MTASTSLAFAGEGALLPATLAVPLGGGGVATTAPGASSSSSSGPSPGPGLKTLGGELIFVGGVLQLVSGQDAIRQAAECRLRTFRGEWFLDAGLGTPWFERILGRKAAAAPVRSVLREELLAVPGVTGVALLNVAFNRPDRLLAVDFVLQTAGGDVAGSVTA